MKINLGCGGVYKKNYVNIDAYDQTVADKKMSAHDLKIDDNSVNEIIASQLIEHLGIIGSIYTFSECFRVLKPKGKLILETPDLKKSFNDFLTGDREARKNLLPWIYGVDMPGMQHRFCYPDDLLEETLQKIGFVNIKKDFFEVETYQPILKITCEKTEDFQTFQMISHFRKKLLQENIMDLDDQILSLEKDDLIVFFTEKTSDFIKTKNQWNINEIFGMGAIRSPIITKFYFEEIPRHGLISKDLAEKYLEFLNIFLENDLPNILFNILKQTPGFIGEQDQLFTTICNLGIGSIEKIDVAEDKSKLINNLRESAKDIKPDERIEFLSPKLIMLKSNRFFQIGFKSFILGDKQKAIDMFRYSASLYRDRIFTYWNLGRLYSLQGEKEKSIIEYKNALILANNLDDKEKIKKLINQEIENIGSIKYDEPIDSFETL